MTLPTDKESIGLRQRDPMFDALKFLAIFLVLWGHAIQQFTSAVYHEEPVYRIIYSFHMPLFMAIVGYFSATVAGDTWSFLRKKFRQLLLPALVVGLIFLFTALYPMGGGKNPDGLVTGIKNYFFSFWFLKSAFICAVLYFVSVKISSRPLTMVLLSLVASQFIFTFKVYLMYPCFLLGVMMNRNIDFLRRYSWQIMVVTGIIFLTMLQAWDQRFWADWPGGIGLFTSVKQMIKAYYRLTIGLMGTIFFVTAFITAFRYLKMTPALNRICAVGQDTLGIYLLQTVLLEMLLPKIITVDSSNFMLFNFVITPAISVVILIACELLLSVIKRSRLLSYLLLGKKLPSHRK